jgi:hypothetical protein
MSASSQLNAATLDNQAFALMSRLHVILRREKGRVTDIEYMRTNAEYCRHILMVAEEAHVNDDLSQICERLTEIYFGADGLFVASAPKPPLMQRKTAAPPPAVDVVKTPSVPIQHNKLPPPMADEAVDNSYIGRLR